MYDGEYFWCGACGDEERKRGLDGVKGIDGVADRAVFGGQEQYSKRAGGDAA